MDKIKSNDIIFTPNCSHSVHLECIYYMASQKSVKCICPLCRGYIKRNTVLNMGVTKIPTLPEYHEYSDTSALIAELLSYNNVVLDDNRIFFNMSSREWIDIFKKLLCVKQSVLKIGDFQCGFYIKNTSYMVSNNKISILVKKNCRKGRNLSMINTMIRDLYGYTIDPLVLPSTDTHYIFNITHGWRTRLFTYDDVLGVTIRNSIPSHEHPGFCDVFFVYSKNQYSSGYMAYEITWDSP